MLAKWPDEITGCKAALPILTMVEVPSPKVNYCQLMG
jgi:hypothetical protein